MNLLVAVYLAGVGLSACLFGAFSLWLKARDEDASDVFLPSVLLALAWPVTVVAVFAMLIVRLAEKEGTS